MLTIYITGAIVYFLMFFMLTCLGAAKLMSEGGNATEKKVLLACALCTFFGWCVWPFAILGLFVLLLLAVTGCIGSK